MPMLNLISIKLHIIHTQILYQSHYSDGDFKAMLGLIAV